MPDTEILGIKWWAKIGLQEKMLDSEPEVLWYTHAETPPRWLDFWVISCFDPLVTLHCP